MVKDWNISRRGNEPKDFWSQSFCYGSVELDGSASSVQVRFKNDGRRKYLRAEVHLAYKTPGQDRTKLTFDWTDSAGTHRESRVFAAADRNLWEMNTADKVTTRWVEFEVVK